jgi:hypothetical protein
MNTIAGIIAGFAVIGAGVAAYRFLARQGSQLRDALDRSGDADASGRRVLDFERDDATGVYRPRR